ncbi:MAG: alpha/beta hydrolase family protein [Alphaproteobacteria bacterium]
MFEYFPDNYPWSLTTSMLFDEVGTAAEPEEALKPLRALAGGDRKIANEAWYEAFTVLGEKLERLGGADEAADHPLTAGRKFHRSGLYHLRAERFLDQDDPRKLMAYRRGIANYRHARELRRDPVDYVDIPYAGKTLPAMFVRPQGTPPWPCFVFVQGFDSLKEWFFPVVGEQFRERGVALLVVDQPGAGGALRLDGMAADLETEKPVGACIDWLEGRKDIDAARIGVMGVSLGGFYAPRAAAFEKRIAACIAWGAIWDFGKSFHDRMVAQRKTFDSIPDMVRQAMWVFGQTTPEGVLDVTGRMKAAAHAGHITCPFLILHGENDRQVPVSDAEALHAAATASPDRTLRIVRLEEGGAEHCQTNNRTVAGDMMADWAARVLGGAPAGAF